MQTPSDVGLGGALRNELDKLSMWLREALRKVPGVGDLLGDCLAPPAEPYEFPRDLYRY